MAKSALQKIYQKKKRLLDDSDAKIRFALAQTRQEAKLETVVFYKIKKLEEHLAVMKKNLDSFQHFHGKPAMQQSIAERLTKNVEGMSTLQKETKELLHGIKSIKKRGYRNVHGLSKNFKHITLLRKKMDKYVDV